MGPTIKILAAEWASAERDAIVVDCEVNGGAMRYAANATDEAPVNKLLWGLLRKKIADGEVRDSLVDRVISGQEPLPDTRILVGREIFDKEHVRVKQIREIRERMAELHGPENDYRARKYPEFEKARQIEGEVLFGFIERLENARDPAATQLAIDLFKGGPEYLDKAIEKEALKRGKAAGGTGDA